MTLLPAITTSFIASILGGALPIWQQRSRSHGQWMHIVHSICDGMFISIALTHFLPELYEHNTFPQFLGYASIIALMCFGLTHLSKDKKGINTDKIVLGLLFSHCFFEGMALPLASNQHIQESLTAAILAHKGVEAFVFFNLIIKKNSSNFSLISLLLIFSSLTPIGIITGDFIKGAPEHLFHFFNALTCGAFLSHGAHCMLLKDCNDHNHTSKAWMVVGFMLIVLVLGGGGHEGCSHAH